MPQIPILTDSAGVARLAGELSRQEAVAVDLEADSLHSYREKVCLLQFSTPERTVLVDPLAGADLSPLGPVLADPAVRKIFHAADYDLRCLHRDFAWTVDGLFDTMIACQLLGEERVGLADVLEKHFGVALDKKHQRADWSLRPLPEEMVRYAADDTRHLHRLAEVLEGQLREKGRLAWAEEEFRLLEAVRFSEAEGPRFLRFKGAGRLPGRALAILEELLNWREMEAERRDCPPFRVLGNRALLEIAQATPRSVKGLVGIEGVSPRLADRYGRALLQRVEAGLELPEERLPAFPRSERRVRDPEAERCLARLKEWRQNRAEALRVSPGILINNAALEEISRARPRNRQELARLPGLKNWQVDELGEEILSRLGG